VITDVAGQVAELKQQAGKDIVVMGSSELAQTLMRHELVDQYRLMVHPVVLGTGKRLFREGAPVRTLALIEATIAASGLATLTYEPVRGRAIAA
jgi:dihydrofolate reductase